jgi:hypothetical protein
VPFGRNRVIATMAVAAAGFAFFFDVGDFAVGRHFAVAAYDATASESGEAEKPNETHDVLRKIAEQVVCRRAAAIVRPPSLHISARIPLSMNVPTATCAREEATCNPTALRKFEDRNDTLDRL